MKPDNGQSTSAQNTLTPAQEYRSNDMEILDYTAPHNAPPSVSRFEECRSLSDTATQCCFDPIILVSVATQTDDVPTTVASDDLSNGSSLDKSQASFTVPAEEWKTSHDHTYSMSVPIVYPTYGLDEDSLAPYTEIEVDPPVDNFDNDFNDKVSDDDFDDECKDPNWNLPNAKKILLSNGNESSEGESEGELDPPDTDKKYLVFGNCLDQLLKRCPKCGVVVTGQKKKTTGSMLSVEMICLDGHITYWDSQPIMKRKPVGNLLLAASILFTGNTFAGGHRQIPSSEAKNICWLKPGSPAHLALEEVVLNTKLLKDLAKLTDFCHTGKIEVYHSMMLKYCSKQEHFSYKGMVARTQLAALDNNANADRPQALVLSGEHAGQKRYKACFPKAHKRWVVKPISEKKSYQYLAALLAQVLERCQAGNAVAEPLPVALPRNIASEPAPSKEDLISNHHSRFNR